MVRFIVCTQTHTWLFEIICCYSRLRVCPIRVVVTFRLMARPGRERNHSFFVKTEYQRPLSLSDKVNRLIVLSSRAAALIVWLYYQTASIASCLAPSPWGVRVYRGLRSQCVTPRGGENNVRARDWLMRTGTYIRARGSDYKRHSLAPHCVCMASWMHMCSVISWLKGRTYFRWL